MEKITFHDLLAYIDNDLNKERYEEITSALGSDVELMSIYELLKGMEESLTIQAQSTKIPRKLQARVAKQLRTVRTSNQLVSQKSQILFAAVASLILGAIVFSSLSQKEIEVSYFNMQPFFEQMKQYLYLLTYLSYAGLAGIMVAFLVFSDRMISSNIINR